MNEFVYQNMSARKCPFICREDASSGKYIDISPEYRGLDDFEDLEDEDFISILKEFFKIERLNDGNPKMFLVSEKVIMFLDDRLRTFIPFQHSSEAQYLVLNEIFRSLRNCASNISTQNCIADKTRILSTCKELFQIIKPSQNCKKIMLQFLINLTTSNRKVTESIHELFYYDIKSCFQESVCTYECSALLYNLSLFRPIIDHDTIECMLELYAGGQQNEFSCFFLENSVSSSELWTSYIEFRLENRLKILDLLKEMLIQDRLNNLSDQGLEVLIKKFLECGEIIFYMNQKNALEAYEISSALEILSSISSREEYLKKLQTRKDIIINAGALLLNIHRLGKSSDNSFTPIQRLSQNESDDEALNSEPVFGFKADLVRLIGNMCWKNFELQNLARTAEIIPVILDSCNIDAKNPFIMQWCILAIRNLCEDNPENQKVIAGLHRQGTVSNEVLDEMGITLNTDGENHLRIVDLESLRK